MRLAFQAFLALFGVIVIAISLAHMAIGPEAVIGAVPVNPTMAGEDRVLAGLLMCYGIALLWCARDVQRKCIYVILLAAVFLRRWDRAPARSPARRRTASLLRRDTRSRVGTAANNGCGGEASGRVG